MGAETDRAEMPPLVRELIGRIPVATLALVDSDGLPHAAPVWFIELDGDFYIASRTTSKKTRIAGSNSRAVLVMEQGQNSCGLIDGHLALRYLRGVVISGDFEVLDPEVEDLEGVASRWAERYIEGPGRDTFNARTLDNHSWLRLRPSGFATWDLDRPSQSE